MERAINMAAPITFTDVVGNRFQGPQKRAASGSLSDLSPNPKKQRLHALLEKAEQYSNFVNDSARFRQSPSYIKGELRHYQVQALNWLISLYENRIGGILADEMGLGKTVQSIAILGYLKYFKHINGPFLVIGTKSVISSWMNEFKKFCPTMKVVELTGDKNTRAMKIKRMEENHNEWDVCVTTFETILNEIFFRRQQWQYVVIDEGHRLHNEKSLFCKLIREVPSKNRLLLTGTPLQNSLRHLWTMLNYLMPHIFNETEIFDCHFDEEEHMKCIKAILQPFFLRRVKADVEVSLLPKIEHKLFVRLTKLQRDTYIQSFERSYYKCNREILQNLRKIANHPYLVPGVEPGPPYESHGVHLINTSGKMMVLDKLLHHLNSNGSRVLLFSQCVDMLDIIEDYLDWRQYIYRRLDGKTSYWSRAKDIDEFNARNSRIFIYIISTRAGALGINLQTADTVIVFDSDLNPLIDLQAIDRAHRIGQKKQVQVYRLIAEDTVDECIVLRAEAKLHLNNMTIERGRVVETSAASAGRVESKMINFGMRAIMDSSGFEVTDVIMSELLRYGKQKSAEIASKLKHMNETELKWAVANTGPVVNLNRVTMPYSPPNDGTPGAVPSSTQGKQQAAEAEKTTASPSTSTSARFEVQPTTTSASVHSNVQPTKATTASLSVSSSDRLEMQPTQLITKTTIKPSTSASVHSKVQPTKATTASLSVSSSDRLEMQRTAMAPSPSVPSIPEKNQLDVRVVQLPGDRLSACRKPLAEATETTASPSASTSVRFEVLPSLEPTIIPSTSSSVHPKVESTTTAPSASLIDCFEMKPTELITKTTIKPSTSAIVHPKVQPTKATTASLSVSSSDRFEMQRTAMAPSPSVPSIPENSQLDVRVAQLPGDRLSACRKPLAEATETTASPSASTSVRFEVLPTLEPTIIPSTSSSVHPKVESTTTAPSASLIDCFDMKPTELITTTTITPSTSATVLSKVQPTDTTTVSLSVSSSDRLEMQSTAMARSVPLIPNNRQPDFRVAQEKKRPTTEATKTTPRQSTSVQVEVEPTVTIEPSTTPSTPSFVHLYVHQFYPVQLIEKCSDNRMLNMSTETELKKSLIAQGFPNWSWIDYKTFCDAVRKFGRFDVSNVAQMMTPSKCFEEVLKYHEQFFGRGPSESAGIKSIVSEILLEEKENHQRNEAFTWKMVQPGGVAVQPIWRRNQKFTSLHDKYLVSAIARYGLAFNVSERIIADIRFHSDFGLFTTFQFGMMTEQEIKDRINHLVSSVRDEYKTFHNSGSR